MIFRKNCTEIHLYMSDRAEDARIECLIEKATKGFADPKMIRKHQELKAVADCRIFPGVLDAWNLVKFVKNLSKNSMQNYQMKNWVVTGDRPIKRPSQMDDRTDGI